MIVESEFGGVLRHSPEGGQQAQRALRQSWDGVRLDSMTKNPMTATKPSRQRHRSHHRRRVARVSARVDVLSGLANRYLSDRAQASPRSSPLAASGPTCRALTGEPAGGGLAIHLAGQPHRDERRRGGLWESVYEGLTTPPRRQYRLGFEPWRAARRSGWRCIMRCSIVRRDRARASYRRVGVVARFGAVRDLHLRRHTGQPRR